MASASQITIVNWTSVQKHFKELDITSKERVKETRTILKKPFNRMKKISKQNLKSISGGSPNWTGALYAGLSVGSRFSKSKGYFTVAFGGRTRRITRDKKPRKARYNKPSKPRAALNHFHLVNSGTKRRYHRNFKGTGAVGKAKNKNHPLMNPTFRTGFADRAIKSVIPSIKMEVVSDLANMYNRIKTAGT